MKRGLALVADLNGRELIVSAAQPGEPPNEPSSFACASMAEVETALRAYVASLGEVLVGAAISGAGPQVDGVLRVTGTQLSLSLAWLRDVLRTPRVFLLNDLAAVALGALKVPERTLRTIVPGKSDKSAALAVVGAGLGLGVAGLLPLKGETWQAIPSEAGHMDFCPSGEREAVVFDAVRKARGDTAAERLLSRKGLGDLHAALAGAPLKEGADDVAGLVASARDGKASALEAMSLYSGLLGAFVGDIALAFAARGGIFINSALVEELGELFDIPAFRRRFLAKGMMASYMDDIPVVLMPGRPVLLGLSSLFSSSDRAFGTSDIKFLDC